MLPKYTLKIALTTLKHLGVNLYSNLPAVLSEVVANSYDADATVVEINIDKANGRVIIIDNGMGMSVEDMNNRFLNVGYDKRAEEGVTTKTHSRHVMGRKGIGKLSLFSVANVVEVRSAKNEQEKSLEENGFIMRTQDIDKAIRERGEYYPEPLETITGNSIIRGTKIVLTDLKKSLDVTESYLRKRLARRFSILDNNFVVKINGEMIGIEDRDYFSKIEYLWTVGEEGEKFKQYAKNVTRTEHIDGVIDAEKNYRISGWIGTFKGQLSVEEGNNTIVLLAWGKLVHEDLLKDLKEAGIYAAYLVGELRADFLDADDEDDIATSDRQSLKETDERFTAIKTYVQREILKRIQGKWSEWRNLDGLEKAQQNPAVAEWLSSLKGDNAKYAKSLFGKIDNFKIEDPDKKNQLYQYGILAFQTLAMKSNLSALNKIESEDQLSLFTELFASIDELEAAHYYQIVKGRMDVLLKFQEIAPTAKEKVIQEHIFTHLWLLDPSWERASTDEYMESRVMKEFDNIDASLTEEEAAGRLDIRYRTAAGKHIIIELKKGDRKIDVADLQKQVRKYRDALMKCLTTAFPEEQRLIEIICLLGSSPEPADKQMEVAQTLAAVNARYITYDTLIRQTRESYREYLEANKKIGEIQRIVGSISPEVSTDAR